MGLEDTLCFKGVIELLKYESFITSEWGHEFLQEDPFLGDLFITMKSVYICESNTQYKQSEIRMSGLPHKGSFRSFLFLRR